MHRLALIFLLTTGFHVGVVHAQHQTSRVKTNNADLSTLEGVTLRHGHSSMLILTNATIQRSNGKASSSAATGNVIAPTFLQKVGPYEIHRSSPASGIALKKSQEDSTINGKSVPAFAEERPGQDFLGAAYLHDTGSIGLISKEISAKFFTKTVPGQYVGMGAKELVPRSGWYVFAVPDIYAWIKLVSKMQADPQVDMVEPHIVTEFAQAQ